MAMADRVAVVTGAGSGIGRAVALGLAGAGWQLVLAGRRGEALERVAAELPAASLCVPTDVSDPRAVETLFAAVGARFGRIDLLFNNAGIFTPAATVDEIPVEDWLASVNVNLTGAFLCTRAAFGMMRRQSPRGGRIINNGSIAAHAPRPMSAPYSATKHAITGLTRATALDGRPFDIACGQIDVGNAETEMTQSFGQGARQADGSIRPEPYMEAVHVAEAVVYMAGLPLSANVLFMTVMATGMPFVGRG
ncbi:SDR family oxidoreductase [Methylorubrum thiocyanatum]|uniref:NAD(P)-dependent dehydrogenase (Short-subunit alcohol dehydrogenase family) n=1 Tax=Methylorubrum thiocyanatum TaxID=47958 RepID=A0AA40VBD9_9HYPH|nr:SDR family oxidoreductase [Methylorubrum thiocyanatum]MBA8913812.1 NAD(P)-dependent dehydrogenase (short-subunit alcohol dehydrogenase family) [Methylorubrum thiocyanatum]GJE82203.1 3-phenylpropionate-dihydrodiol/cinnamic acid-dihydrodiol dehydrogenase [Methylorubrum thiocyanatum]